MLESVGFSPFALSTSSSPWHFKKCSCSFDRWFLKDLPIWKSITSTTIFEDKSTSKFVYKNDRNFVNDNEQEWHKIRNIIFSYLTKILSRRLALTDLGTFLQSVYSKGHSLRHIMPHSLLNFSAFGPIACLKSSQNSTVNLTPPIRFLTFFTISPRVGPRLLLLKDDEAPSDCDVFVEAVAIMQQFQVNC